MLTDLVVLNVSRSEPSSYAICYCSWIWQCSYYTGSACEQLCGRARAIEVHTSLCGCCCLRTKLKTTNDIMHVILDTRPSRAFQRATLKCWEWPGDEATYMYVRTSKKYKVHQRSRLSEYAYHQIVTSKNQKTKGKLPSAFSIIYSY